MLPHSGPGSRTFREVVALGEELVRIGEVAGTTSHAEIAILFDWNGWWGLEDMYGLPRNDFSYPDTVMRHYAPLFAAHLAVDVVNATAALAGYKVLVIPNAYLIDDEGAANIAAFVENGGTVVISFFSGVVDESNRVRPDGYPGAFRKLIGARIDEYWPARDGERFDVEFADGRHGTSTWWRDDIHLEAGTAVATYRGGLLDGRAAVVRNTYGAGTVTYLATLLDDDAFSSVLREAVEAAGVRNPFAGVPEHVECAVRLADDAEFVFLLNHSGDEAATVPLEGGGRDLVSGTDVIDSIRLEPLGAAVIRRAR
jgi:beta-galactosidase